MGYYFFSDNKIGGAQVLSWNEYSQQVEVNKDTRQVIELPEGTILPIHLSVGSEFMAKEITVEIPLKISKTMQLAVKNGVAEDHYNNLDGERIKRYWMLKADNETVVSDDEGLYMNMNLNIVAQ